MNKEKIKKDKLFYLSVIILVMLVLLLILYIYKINRYKYEVIFKDFNYNDYYVRLYDDRVNVIKKVNECDEDKCELVNNGKYDIEFEEKYLNEIYDYVYDLFKDNNDKSITIMFDDIKDYKELNIIKSIVFNDEKYMKLENSFYDYKIVTNTTYLTMQNDGGSNTNIYYQIYLDENKIIKYEDRYVGFKGYEYKGKVIYKKNFDNNDLKFIIEDLIVKEDVNDNNNYTPYVLEYSGENKKIYNSNSIELLKEMLNLFDNQWKNIE